MDSLLSIVQMPGGVPVGCLAIGTSGAINAAILATSILSTSGQFPDIEDALIQFRKDQTNNVAEEPVDDPKMKESKSITSIPTSSFSSFIPSSTSLKKEELKNKIGKKLIPPGSIIGILGGGQLGKMIAQSATQLGYKVHIYCPDEKSPAFHSSSFQTISSYTDSSSLLDFASKVDVITYEFENIPDQTIHTLEKYVSVHPNSQILSVCQNRIKEKTFVNSIGIPTARFEKIFEREDLWNAIEKIGFPSVLKTNRMGYDGKGQVILHSKDEVEDAWKKLGHAHCILESFIDFFMEISVIVARGKDGQKKAFPVVENKHQNHILKESLVPPNLSESVQLLATNYALKIAEHFELIGVLAVEMFVTKELTILVNEIAPRPHNSGHWTIEGSKTSQFEQLIRSICGLPLGNTQLICSKVQMKNLIGNEVEEWSSILEDETAHLHFYGKDEVREGRKMGHVTRLYFS